MPKPKTKKRRRAAAKESCPKTTQILRSRLQIEAAGLAADGKLSVMEIAEKIGVSKKTIDRWAKVPAFQEAKRKILEEAERKVMSTGVANKVRRVEAINRRWEQMTQLIAARSVDPAMAAVPGGKTGVLVRQVKSIGFGDKNQLVEEYAFDAPLFRELRELEKHAAMEVGQYGGTAEVFVGGSGGAGQSGPPTKVTFEWQSSDSSSGTTNSPASGGSTMPGQSSKAIAAR